MPWKHGRTKESEGYEMKGKVGNIKKHILTAISYMIPLVVAAGLCMALGQVVDSDVRNSTAGLGY